MNEVIPISNISVVHKAKQSSSQQTQGGQNTQNDVQSPISAHGNTTGAVKNANDHKANGLYFTFNSKNNQAF